MSSEIIKAPNLGSTEAVEVIEVCVKAGDIIAAEDSLLVLESDKASMEVPAPKGGKVLAVLVKEGDMVNEGDPILELEAIADEETASAAADNAETLSSPAAAKTEPVAAPAAAVTSPASARIEEIHVPDIGSDGEVELIEVCINVGDEIAEGDSLIVLESDKASMEIPSPYAGVVETIHLKEGDKVKQGALVLSLAIASDTVVIKEEKPVEMPTPAADARQGLTEPKEVTEKYEQITNMSSSRPTGDVYAGPAVRKMAREIGLDLAMVPGSGPKGRIQKDDVKTFIKEVLDNKRNPIAVAGGLGIPSVPEVDFSQFGDISIEKMSKMHKLTAANMHRSWLNVPHVTAFDDIDITELEEFRASLKTEAEKAGVKITPLPFILKACAIALKANPKVNASLHSDGESVVYKNYVHIGIAVDTPAGLMVPVVRDVDKKTLFELAAETAELAQKAKDRKLMPNEMQGGSFTVSSLGAMGGTGFTPIVNIPESAILGVSRMDIKPRWDGKAFVPRKMLPVTLSYDHRLINGADAGKFSMMLNSLLSDIRRLVL